jgi:hypothetical protein
MSVHRRPDRVWDPIITFDNVGVTFGKEQIYDRLSFDVRRGEFASSGRRAAANRPRCGSSAAC